MAKNNKPKKPKTGDLFRDALIGKLKQIGLYQS
jgi:hypothetical protein